jgi:hypothetical protein
MLAKKLVRAAKKVEEKDSPESPVSISFWKEEKLAGKSSGVVRVSFIAFTSQWLGEQ